MATGFFLIFPVFSILITMANFFPAEAPRFFSSGYGSSVFFKLLRLRLRLQGAKTFGSLRLRLLTICQVW